MPYTPTIEVELARLEYERLLDAVENGPEVWADSTPIEREDMARREAELAEARESAIPFGPEAFEYVTGERLALFAGEDWCADDADSVGLYSVAVLRTPEGAPVIAYGTDAGPLASDLQSAMRYLRSIGLQAEYLRDCGHSDDGRIGFLAVS